VNESLGIVYLFNAREIELKPIVNPSQYLIPPYKVPAVHHSYIRRHCNAFKQFSRTERETERERDGKMRKKDNEWIMAIKSVIFGGIF
jgi:hypothetical protein